jgi:YHS domain-containing protein
MWLRTLLLALLIFLIVRAVMRLLGGVVQGATTAPSGRRRRRGPVPVKMVADPVCGTYVIPGKALEAARGRDVMYFCSEKCRDQWVAAR